ncbi:MAG: mannose-1-phosphate guanylyltransferase [Candidatus Aminicenantales bacterium]
MDIRAVIIAGGAGTRFWPLSRRQRPKQFLPIISEKTMVEETVLRILPVVPAEKIYTIATQEKTQIIKELLPDIPEENLLVEPEGKNTCPSLMLASAHIYLENPQAVVAALPSDHLIKDTSLFLRLLKAGASAAGEGEFLITFGITPSYPATGYGYIHYQEGNGLRVEGESFFRVSEFKEKPSSEQAAAFLQEGNFLWNSGMFLWQVEVFARKLKSYASQLYPFWERMVKVLKTNKRGGMEDIFREIPKISIDYGLMEKAEGVLVCPGKFGWSDVGAWSSLMDIWPRDSHGIASRGEVVCLESRECLSYNPGKLTVFIGVEDLIVVNTDDALLICLKDKDQKVKDIVNIIEKKGKTEFL